MNDMRKAVLLFLTLVAPFYQLLAQGTLNVTGDNILGVYLGEQKGDVFKARITKVSDGTYEGDEFFGWRTTRNPTEANASTARIRTKACVMFLATRSCFSLG